MRGFDRISRGKRDSRGIRVTTLRRLVRFSRMTHTSSQHPPHVSIVITISRGAHSLLSLSRVGRAVIGLSIMRVAARHHLPRGTSSRKLSRVVRVVSFTITIYPPHLSIVTTISLGAHAFVGSDTASLPVQAV
jgi:hypothetical protein